MSCLKILLSINEARELLIKYATKNLNSELILFLIDLEKYKKDRSIANFFNLLQDYIIKDSMYELNIPYDMKNKIHIDNNTEDFKEIETHIKMLINQHLLIDDFVVFIEKHYKELETHKKPTFSIFQRRNSSTKI